MAYLNINRSITDQFYRYKMPKLIAKVEGKGNGIKTVIDNMTDIAKSLKRPPTYPTKYFGCELGAQTQFDSKNDRYIVNGAHDAARLQDLLDGFIRRFVLCPECDNPETLLNVQEKKGMIRQRCIACGNQTNIDMRHKLTTFMLKNPPGSESVVATPNKKDKRGKKGKKDASDEKSPETNGKEDDTSENIQPEEEEDDGFDDWGVDTSDAAMQARMEELTDAARGLALSEDLDKSQQERVNIFYKFVKDKRNSDALKNTDREILAEAERLDVKDKAPLVLAELLLDQNILTQIKTYRNHFLRFTHENQKAQKYLLGGFEQLVGNVYKDDLMPKVPHILKALYDCDMLDEEVIIDWDKKMSKKYVSKEIAKEIHDKAAPVIKWLQEAEEESEDEESDEEVEVVYSHTEKVGTHIIAHAENGKDDDKQEEEEDDFDIDAI